jgi:putative hydrolase of the HAD superfamily
LYKDVNAAYWLRYEKGEVTKEVLRTARFTDTFNAMGLEAALQPANVWQEYLDICPIMTRMMPGALDCLAELKKKYRIALLTNGFERTQQTKISVSGIGEFVDFMMTSESVGMAKPDSRFFALALEKAGCNAQEAVYLGDTWHTDVDGGMGAGIVSYWYRRGQDRRDLPLDDSNFGGVVDDLMDFARL